MEEGVASKEAGVGSCCEKLSVKCSQLVEGRKNLKKAVAILKESINKIEEENARLKKECEEARGLAANECERKQKELEVSLSLEKEVSALKSEVSSLRQRGNLDTEGKDGEIKLLREQVSEGKSETSKLKELLDKQIQRAVTEKKNADAEKRKAAEAQKSMKTEKARADKEMKCTATERKRAEDYQIQLEALKKECADFRQKEKEFMLFKDGASERDKELGRLRDLLEKEKTRAEFATKAAEAERKNSMEASNQVKAASAIAEERLVQLESLKKAVDEANMKFLQEKEGKEKESAARASLEITVSALMSEISFLKKSTANVRETERDINVLQENDCGRELETDLAMGHVEKLDEKECSQSDIAELKPGDASERLVNASPGHAHADRGLGLFNEKKAEGCLLQLQALLKEAEETKSMLVVEKEEKGRLVALRVSLEEEIMALKSQICCLQQRGAEDRGLLHDKEREIKQLKELVNKGMMQLDSEKKKVEVHKKFADEACEQLKAEKSKLTTESKIAKSEATKAEGFRNQLDCLQKEFLTMQSKLASQTEKMKKELEMERQNVIKARQLVETESAKADDLRKLAEANVKMAAKEKSLADDLSRQLEDYKAKNKELQKCVHQLFHSLNVPEFAGISPAKVKEAKLLEKQLKLEKMRYKHAKQVVKFEKNRSAILIQELGNLRHDFARISCRLDVVGKYFSPSVEGISDAKKDGGLGDVQCLKVARKACRVEPFQMNTQNGSETFNPSCTGIDSELKSLHGSSNPKLLPHSAMNSSSTSFSDGELVRSQDRGAFVLSSEKLVEDNFDTQQTVPFMFAAVKGLHKNMTITSNHHNWKDQLAFDTIESVKHLFMEDKKLHLQMNEKIHVLDQVLNGQKDVPLEAQTDLYGSSVKHERLHKRRKLSPKEDVVLPYFLAVDEPGNRKMVREQVVNDANGTGYSYPNDAFITVAQACGDTSPSFEGIADGDYMKLLDLDDINEEEIYKNAMNRPLSPTLPDIYSSQAFVSCEDESRKTEIRSVLDKNDSLTPAINVEMHCDASRGNDPTTSHEDSMLENDGVIRDVRVQSVEAEKTMDCWPRDSRYGIETSHIPAYCVTSVVDTRSIYQVLHSTRACMAHCSSNTRANSMLERILQAVTTQGTMPSRERSCVLFTLLLWNFSALKLADSGRIGYKDLTVHVDSLVRDLKPVTSISRERSLFGGVCSLHELLGTIEDFLINGTVVDCSNISSETLNEWNSKCDVVPCDKEPKFSTKLATVEQLLIGSALLSSICASTGHVEFVCDTSFNLLHKSGPDAARLLTILHVFARVVGEQYFSVSDYGLTMNVVRSIVGWLERSSRVTPIHTCLSSNEATRLQFDGCTKCPFGAVSVDIVTSVLLEKLWSSVDSGAIQQHRRQSNSSSEAKVVYREHYEVDSAIGQSNSIMNATLGDTSNVLSLLELVACKMGWEWTQSKIVPELLEIMGRPLSSTFQIAVLLFLGQLGRFGVAASGYEDAGVESLKSKLSGFLRQQLTKESIIPVQMATVASLLRLQPLGFEQVTDENFSCLADAACQPDMIRLVRDWICRLSKDQRTTSLSFLQSQIAGS
ncbi:unnamed protein product [Linum trigynum]|uniref:Uncharacterized protein n=1 Tax=Linum trigynum TaxID=586398 RepID=A0AAV2FWS7_9ROSI